MKEPENNPSTGNQGGLMDKFFSDGLEGLAGKFEGLAGKFNTSASKELDTAGANQPNKDP